MTVSSTTRKAGPYAGNGVATTFPFSFKIFKKADIAVIVANASGTGSTLTLDSDYSVSLNADQNSNPGGSITYPISGTPLQATYTLTILGALPYEQPTDITNMGGFYPSVIEDALDRAEIQIQQLAEITSRTIQTPPADGTSVVLPSAGARADTLLGFDDLGNLTTLPLSSSIGGGDMRTDTYRAVNGDFVPGTTRAFTLSRDPGSSNNVWAWWDGVPQFDYALTGGVLTFNEPVDVNVGVVRIRTGTVLSLYAPAADSVGDAALQWGDQLARCFTSIANLRATGDSRYRVAFVTGYYAPHDGGGGPYVVDSSDTTSADNGGSIIVDELGRRWKLNTPPDWFVEQFGAKGDGATDDTAAIQAAIDALPARGGTVRFMGKQYGVSNTIKAGDGNGGVNKSTKNGIKLIGQGAGYGGASPPPTLIQLLSKAPTGTPYVDVLLAFNGAITNSYVQDMTIYCSLQANVAVKMTAACGVQMRNVVLAQYVAIGLWLQGGAAPTGNYNIQNEFHNLLCATTHDGHRGLFVDGDYSAINDTWLTSFYNCRFDTTSASGSYAGYFRFSDSCSFYRCHFVGNYPVVGGSKGIMFDAVGNNQYPGGHCFHDCSIISTDVNENTTDKIGIMSFTNYGVDDHETLPSHTSLKGYTIHGTPFNGWGT
ncbi:Pectate lyase-like protein [Paraburkholderia tropica]